VPGSIVDATADRVMYLAGGSSPELRIRDLATDETAVVPVPTGRHPVQLGSLISGGALYASRVTDVTTSRIEEWRNGQLTSLGPLNSETSIVVAGNYAIWSNGSTLFRRSLAASQTDTIATDAGNVNNDVAANGDVVYWDNSYSVRLWHNGSSVQVSQQPPSMWATYPLTDGTNIVYRETTLCCFNEAGVIAFSDGQSETVLDSFRTGRWPEPGSDYRASNGWIAFTRPNSTPDSALNVWTRDPDGSLDQVSQDPQADDHTWMVGLNPSGQVMYSRFNNGDGTTYLGAADRVPFPLGGFYHRAFWANGHWYIIENGLEKGSLLRVDTDTAITAGPPNYTTDTTASFVFASTAQDSTFQCRLDEAAWESCSLPWSYSNLPEGTHTFSVAATDEATNEEDTTPASATWVVDHTPPAAPALTDSDPDSPANDNAPKLKGSAEAGSTVRLYTNPGCTGTPAAEGPAVEFASPGLAVSVADNSSTGFRATATDKAGNVSPCSDSLTYSEVSPPSAAIAVSPTTALTGDTVSFDASASSDHPGGTITRYQWDLDGDGSFETDTGASPTASRTFSAPAEIDPGVRVTSNSGHSGEARASLSIRLRPPPGLVGVSINGGARFTNDPDVTLSPVWPAYSVRVVVSNDGGFAHPRIFPVNASVPWRLDSSGSERLPKTVYLRFDDSPQTFTDDIILDETRPTVEAATFAGSRDGAASARERKRRYRIQLRASDNLAGIVGYQVTTKRRRPGKLRAFSRHRRKVRRTISVAAPSSRLYIRVRDAAGNNSKWRRVLRVRTAMR
jgi:hypothetical protein